MKELPRVLCADPPWKFSDGLPGNGRGAAKNYDVMTTQAICDMRIPEVADDAYLFLWRVSSMVEDAYLVARHWGFVAKSEIVWQKLAKTGKPWFGMGRTVRASHETCIIATRGRPRPLDRSIRSTFSAPVSVGADGKYLHSGKPEEFFDIVEQLCAGPYVELFSRRQRDGWICLGDEMETPTVLGDAP